MPSISRVSAVSAVLMAASIMAGAVPAMPTAAAAASGITPTVGSADGWGKAIEVPGTATLNTGSDAEVLSVSCASAGNCGAGGSYFSHRFRGQAFVVSERRGVWHTAIKVPGTAALNKYENAATTAVSCPSAGNCRTVPSGLVTTTGSQYHVLSVSPVVVATQPPWLAVVNS